MSNAQNQSESARAYWRESMEEAHAFMDAIMDYPVRECGEPVDSLRAAAEEAGVEVEFSDRPHVGGRPRLFLLRQGLLRNFVSVARQMNERGWVLKVEDAYRTLQMQKGLALLPETFEVVVRRLLWECDGSRPSPQLVVRRLGVLVAPCAKLGTHTSASALDISVLSREDGREVDRGGAYLDLSERTPMDSPFVGREASQNRAEITQVMRTHGFAAYPWEFWHYSQGDAFDEYLNATGRAARYGPVRVDPGSGRVTPLQSPTALLNPQEEMERRIESALRRLCAS